VRRKSVKAVQRLVKMLPPEIQAAAAMLRRARPVFCAGARKRCECECARQVMHSGVKGYASSACVAGCGVRCEKKAQECVCRSGMQQAGRWCGVRHPGLPSMPGR